MKTIGIIGGIAWPSTITYYQDINRLIAEKLGPQHCAKLMLVQTDYDQMKKYFDDDAWDKVAETLLSLAQQLECGGADFILVACNTAHKAIPAVQAKIKLPILHIVDGVSAEIRQKGFKKVGLLGSHVTMTDGFFTSRLEKNQIETMIPSEEDRKTVHNALVTELAMGKVLPETRGRFKSVIHRLVEEGAEAVILGCTEFGMLVRVGDCSVPLIDSAKVHSEAAVQMALS
ncbi:aspartate racemase [Penicillium argentinense]|uniref:Aspartate racemase n=1 Tax=Penicillium argentinense TaxID=1131581 RepID=A0A9W9KNQ2_9EURO|nr:aspartate racemase [Penicillium argentinense]KAJ5112246.1 aspartate racemase [Penicillium argentinense]